MSMDHSHVVDMWEFLGYFPLDKYPIQRQWVRYLVCGAPYVLSGGVKPCTTMVACLTAVALPVVALRQVTYLPLFQIASILDTGTFPIFSWHILYKELRRCSSNVKFHDNLCRVIWDRDLKQGMNCIAALPPWWKIVEPLSASKMCPSSRWAVDGNKECRASYKVKQLNHVFGTWRWGWTY